MIKMNPGLLIGFISLLLFVFISNTIADDLQGEWRFEEGTGTTALDTSGNGNDGNLVNMGASPWGAGMVGGGLEFDGNGYVDINTSFNYNSGTISAWVDIPTDTDQLHILTDFGEATYTSTLRVYIDWRNDLARFNVICIVDGVTKWAIRYDLDSDSLGVTGTQAHVCVTHNGNEPKLYFNGIEAPITWITDVDRTAFLYDIFNATTPAVKLRIGKTLSNVYGYVGTFDEFKIYSRHLSEQEIYKEYLKGYLRGEWSFESGSVITSDGKVGSAGDFTGTNDYLDLTDNGATLPELSFTSSEPWTLEAWVLWDNIETSAHDFWIGSDNGTEIFEFFESGGIRFRQSDYNYVYLMNEYSVYENQWTHHAYVADGNGNLSLYINGIFYNTVSANTQFHLDNIGRPYSNYDSNGTGYKEFNGLIDEVKIYALALNDDDIYNSFLAGDLCGEWSFEEGVGTTVHDASNNAYDGTLNNMSSTSWVDGNIGNGEFGKALEFDGTDDYVEILSDGTGKFDYQSFTIAAWFKSDTDPDTASQVIWSYDATAHSTPYYSQHIRLGGVGGMSDEICFFWNNGSIHHGVLANGALTGRLSEWHHIAVTFEYGSQKLYLDGECIASESYEDTINYYPQEVWIGKGNFGGYFNGMIDDVKFYKRVLSASEIKGFMHNKLEAYLERSYYTNETSTTVFYSLNVSASELTNTIISAVCGGVILGQDTTPETQNSLAIDISNLSVGTHTIAIELKNASGDLIFRRNVTLIKKQTNSTGEWKIDHKKRVVLKDGTPFFPIAVWYDNDTNYDVDLQEIKDAGFNTVLLCYPSIFDLDDFMTDANAEGLLVMPYPIQEILSYLDFTEAPEDSYYDYMTNHSAVISSINEYKLYSNLIGYYNIDEWSAPKALVAKAFAYDVYDNDQYHPVYQLCHASSLFITEDDFKDDYWDVLGADPYWEAPDRVDNRYIYTPNYISYSTCRINQMASKARKPVWMQLLLSYWSGAYKRVYTPEEHKSQAYLALIHGAKGLFYWMYRAGMTMHVSTWEALEDIIEQMDTLGPTVLNDEVPQTISYGSGEYKFNFMNNNPVTNDDFPDVQVALKKNPSGGYVLLAANSRSYSVDVSYTLDCLTGISTVGRLFDTSTYSVSNNSFSDTLAGFATRAYIINCGTISSANISVSLDPEDNPVFEEVIPKTGRPGEKNLVQNPSFELATLTDWPDYYFPLSGGVVFDNYSTGTFIGGTNSCWKLDTETPTISGVDFGDYSLKTQGRSLYFRLRPQHQDAGGRNYIFSAYFKTNVSNVKIKMGSATWPSGVAQWGDEETLSTQWERKYVIINVPPNQSEQLRWCIKFTSLGANASIWIDGVQVEEQGSNNGPTVFEP